MINETHIKIINTDLKLEPTISDTQFSLSNDGYCKPLQRVIFWVLKKLKANSILWKELRYEKEVISSKNFDDLFGSQFGQLMQVGYSPDFIVCGTDEYKKLLLSAYRPELCADVKDLRFHGLPLVVVPWLKGFFLMPKLDENRQLARMEFVAPEGPEPTTFLQPPRTAL